MDLATILGILSGIGLITYTIFAQGNPDIFIHIPSIMVVFGGTMAATLVNYPIRELLGVLQVARKTFKSEPVHEVTLIPLLVRLAIKARREGILSLEEELKNINDPFLRSGLEMVVDGTEPETIRNVMETELEYLIERHKRGQRIFTSLGTYSPAFGMIGTLIGLIAMLKTLNNPANIGSGMAIALITTFYGALAANLVFLPMAGKLKNLSDEEVIMKEMILEGILAIQFGEHPRNIERKLRNFLPPKLRAQVRVEYQRQPWSP